MKRVSNRMIRINEEIRKELVYIIRDEIKDPRVDKLLTIVKVEATNDLKFCKVYISSLAEEKKRNETITGLKNAEKYIRHELAKRLNLRNTPEINFIMDTSIEYSVHMSDLFRKIEPVSQDEDEKDE
ncbi:30S ribosome-binding factor RbfA [Vallitalea okinawensis]|uniref:30S ribosome-binding factor RbfA n=1 Tax=Vallitalea okinawensis TaxID=2078660 RepID=UPI000CFBFAC2|nr:30S ribosome-binding factor RbfA [Vallitalea okinawensis]